MNKLEFKHVSPYLPYKLLFFVDFKDGETSALELEGLTNAEIFLDGYDSNYNDECCKLILKPLADLNKKTKINGILDSYYNHLRRINPYLDNDLSFYIEPTSEGYACSCDNVEISFKDYIDIYNKLLEWHFDIFGLLEKGLAIDVNKI